MVHLPCTIQGIIGNTGKPVGKTTCRFNVFFYADNILIYSTSVTGLQNLIESAVKYVSGHGLRFNPKKTKVCHIRWKPFWCVAKLVY